MSDSAIARLSNGQHPKTSCAGTPWRISTVERGSDRNVHRPHNPRRLRSNPPVRLIAPHDPDRDAPLRVLLAQQGHPPERLDDRPDAGQPAAPARCCASPMRCGSARDRPQRPYATRVPKDKRQPDGARRPDPARHDAPAPPARGRTAPVHGDRCRQPLRRGRGPGDRLGGDGAATSSTSSSPGCRCPSRRSRSMGAASSWPGSRRPAGQRGIALYVLPPRSPKLNGRVERLNGTEGRCHFGEICLYSECDLVSMCMTSRGVPQGHPRKGALWGRCVGRELGET